MRDFTPRSFDTEQGKLVIDFALHESGPATGWAVAAKVGDTLEIGGPRGSAVIPDDFDWYLLIGDETALPAIGRRVEELRPDVPVTTIAVIASLEETQTFKTKARWTPAWCVRNGKVDDAALLRAALEARVPSTGRGLHLDRGRGRCRARAAQLPAERSTISARMDQGCRLLDTRQNRFAHAHR